MTTDDATESKRFIVDLNKLPSLFPTHRHSPMFWEALGRTIATFGFLEEVLGKAIFAFTATHSTRKVILMRHTQDGCRPLKKR